MQCANPELRLKQDNKKKCLLQLMSMSRSIVSSVASTGTLETSIFNSIDFCFLQRNTVRTFVLGKIFGTHSLRMLSFLLWIWLWSPTNTFNQFENLIHNIFRNENSTLEINVSHFWVAA